jgi:hypothetical protein
MPARGARNRPGSFVPGPPVMVLDCPALAAASFTDATSKVGPVGGDRKARREDSQAKKA